MVRVILFSLRIKKLNYPFSLDLNINMVLFQFLVSNIRKAIADAESGNAVAFATGKVLFLPFWDIHSPFGIPLILGEKLRNKFQYNFTGITFFKF